MRQAGTGVLSLYRGPAKRPITTRSHLGATENAGLEISAPNCRGVLSVVAKSVSWRREPRGRANRSIAATQFFCLNGYRDPFPAGGPAHMHAVLNGFWLIRPYLLTSWPIVEVENQLKGYCYAGLAHGL